MHEVMFYYIWWEFFKGSFVKIFAEKVARENSVQIHPNFPAKSLSIYTKNFPWHLFYWFNYLSYIKIICWIWNFGGLLSRYWETIKVDIKTDLLTLLLIIQENKYTFTAKEIKKKKKLAHAYFKHRIFSKSFGGKIRHIWTDVIYRMNKEKLAHASFKHPYFFLAGNFSS